jgi:antitoxin PrlF
MQGSLLVMADTLSLITKSQALEEKLIAESTLTDRYQTTIPDTVRKLLGLGKRDKIAYSVGSDGRIYLSSTKDEENDPIVEKFLDFLAREIEKNPQRVKPVTTEWADRLQALVKEVDIGDLNEPLSGDD